MTTFKDLGLKSQLLDSITELGYTEPSPIQEKAIPFVLGSKRDLIALAQTGTGKTAAFGLPILNQLDVEGKKLQAIILCPTRELCIQISRDLVSMGKHVKGLAVTPVYGGSSIENQVHALRRGTNIVVGTPGRVHDLIRRKFLKLQDIEWLVLDEADEMLDMGFKEDLDAILEQVPSSRQTLLFSATISRSVHSIAKHYMKDAMEISVGTKNVGAEKVTHEFYVVKGHDRFEALMRILDNLPGVYGILFCRTKLETQEIADKLKRAHYDADALHGDVSQVMRTRIMDAFKKKKTGLLVATDVAARGIDVSDLSHVINYNLPDTNESYTHRTGRTGRASKSGVAISIITAKDAFRIRDLERTVGKKFEKKFVPTGEDIRQKQITAYLDEIEGMDIAKVGVDELFADAVHRLSQHTKEEIVKMFLVNRFASQFEPSRVGHDLNDSATDKSVRGRKTLGVNETTLKINFGKKDGFMLSTLFGIINSDDKMHGLDLGHIHLGPEYSTFTVESRIAEDVAHALSAKSYRGKRIVVKVVEGEPEQDSYREAKSSERYGSRRPAPGRSHDNKRGGYQGKKAYPKKRY